MTNYLPLCICANAFPTDTHEDFNRHLQETFPKLRQAMALKDNEICPIGLWLPDCAASEILQENRQRLFQRQLRQAGFTAYTANAFPFGKFHGTAVKTDVYKPDWTTPERLHYTLNVARILAEILPDNGRGSISTLPAGYQGMSEDMLQETAKNLRRCAGYLARLKDQTGKHIDLAIEMEPDCQWENPIRFADFYDQSLADYPYVREHLGVCYDTCHQELLGGTPGQGLITLLKRGIPVPKIQFSAALAVTSPDGWQNLLRDYQDEVYLHQTRIMDDSRQILKTFPDMPADMPELARTSHRTIVHFHVPISQTQLAPGLETAKDELMSTLEILREYPDFKPDLEIETYTYSVLPGFQHDQEAIIAEMGKEFEFIRNGLAR